MTTDIEYHFCGEIDAMNRRQWVSGQWVSELSLAAVARPAPSPQFPNKRKDDMVRESRPFPPPFATPLIPIPNGPPEYDEEACGKKWVAEHNRKLERRWHTQGQAAQEETTMMPAGPGYINDCITCDCGAPMKAGEAKCEACFKKVIRYMGLRADDLERNCHEEQRVCHEEQVAAELIEEDWDLAKDCMTVWGVSAFTCAVLWSLDAMTPFAFAVALALEVMNQ